MATGEKVGTSAALEPCTSEIDTFKVSFPGYNIVFIDTPGFDTPDFDDLNSSDDKILKMISKWLAET
jgi:GTPase Era involved in 16S rRNA processing